MKSIYRTRSGRYEIELFGDEVEELVSFDALTGESLRRHDRVAVYPKSHFVTPRDRILKAVESIRSETGRTSWFS